MFLILGTFLVLIKNAAWDYIEKFVERAILLGIRSGLRSDEITEFYGFVVFDGGKHERIYKPRIRIGLHGRGRRLFAQPINRLGSAIHNI